MEKIIKGTFFKFFDSESMAFLASAVVSMTDLIVVGSAAEGTAVSI